MTDRVTSRPTLLQQMLRFMPTADLFLHRADLLAEQADNEQKKDRLLADLAALEKEIEARAATSDAEPDAPGAA